MRLLCSGDPQRSGWHETVLIHIRNPKRRSAKIGGGRRATACDSAALQSSINNHCNVSTKKKIDKSQQRMRRLLSCRRDVSVGCLGNRS